MALSFVFRRYAFSFVIHSVFGNILVVRIFMVIRDEEIVMTDHSLSICAK